MRTSPFGLICEKVWANRANTIKYKTYQPHMLAAKRDRATTMKKKHLDIYIAVPRGFCAGVVRAIETVENMLKKHGRPIYVLHEIVHNKHVIKELEKKGAIFVEKLQDIPPGKICIFSAHGVSVGTEAAASRWGLHTVDGTCPLVSSIHRIVEKHAKEGFDIVIIGHHNHPEVMGTAGRTDIDVSIVATRDEAEHLVLKKPGKCVYVTQTTLSQDEVLQIEETLQRRFPRIQHPNRTICYATQNRQNAVRKLAYNSELIFVVGSKNSSNSNRLREVAVSENIEAYLIDDSRDIHEAWVAGKKTIGITAGASAPERLVEEVVDWLAQRFTVTTHEIGDNEKKLHFKPADLK